MAIHEKRFLLEVWLKDALCATQREANIVAELLALTGEITACCHSTLLPFTFITIFYIILVISPFVKREGSGIIKVMDIWNIVIVLGIILVSMMLHELMHGFVALKLGDDTARLLGRLSFNPIKHVDPFLTIMLPLLIVVTNGLTGANMPIFGGAKPVPINPANIRSEWGVALIAASGPLVNLVLAFVSYGILAATGGDTSGVMGAILVASVSVNLGFFAFNILPIPPLDGSRVLYALAPDFVRKGMDAIERYGAVFVFALVLLFNDVLFQYMSGLITVLVTLFARVFGIS